MKGFQIVADFYGCVCEDELLFAAAPLAAVCEQACAQAGLTVVARAFHQFGDELNPGGATGALVLAESHLAIHTWPELRAATMDLYVCNLNSDNKERAQLLYSTLHDVFKPQQVQSQTLQRGDLAQRLASVRL